MNAVSAKPLPHQDLDHAVTHARQDFESLRGARLLVTGGTGFFGKWLVSTFVHANHTLGLGATMVLLTRNPVRFREESPDLAADAAISLHQGDVKGFDFPSGEFSHIIHGAAGGGDQPLDVFDTIVLGTRRTLECAARAGTKRLLFLSSGAVYGPQPPSITHIPETYSGGPDPLQPGSTYGEAKRAAEHLCSAFSRGSGFETTIARCFAFSGPALPLNTNFAIGNFIGDVLAGRPITIQGDGTPYRSYLYAADLAVWLWGILVRGEHRRAYNVGSDEELTIAALANAVAAMSCSGAKIQIARQPVPGVAPLRYVPSIERARVELGLERRIQMKEGIQRTLEWLRS
jgi:nucleoside-diphosphate-sugar epimerase